MKTKWTKKRRLAHSQRMKVVWNSKREANPNGRFQVTRRYLAKDDYTRRQKMKISVDGMIDLMIKVMGPKLTLEAMRNALHDFVERALS